MLILQKNVVPKTSVCSCENVLHKQSCLLPPLIAAEQETFWRLLNSSVVFCLATEPITIRPKVGPTTACVQKLSLTLILHWNFIPQQHHSCQQESRLPCCSGDLPAGSSLVTSSGTHRLCNSRVSTDRQRQNARQPLEGRHERMEHGSKYLDIHCETYCIWKILSGKVKN